MAAKKTKKKSAGKAKTAAKKKAPAKKSVAARKAPAKKKVAARKAAAPKGPANQIVHWEIQSQQPEKLHAFYAAALGWKINANNPMNYGMVSSGGKDGIDGGIGGSSGASGSRVLAYAAVKSIPTILAQVEHHGGRTIMPRTDVGPVIMALYQDPEGNTMGLIEG